MISKLACVFTVVFAVWGVTTSSGYAFEKNELVIWVGSDKAHEGIRKAARRFTRDFDFLTVKVETPENITDRFQQAAASGSGPDMIFWAHDRYGEWAMSGLLASVDPSPTFKSGVNPIGWEAMTSHGKIYGYPVSMEAISLIYNRDIIQEPPGSFEEMFSLTTKAWRNVPSQYAEKGTAQRQQRYNHPYVGPGAAIFQHAAAGCGWWLRLQKNS